MATPFVYVSTSMATREGLNKLKIDFLRQLAIERDIDTKNVKKDDLIGKLLESQVNLTALTPVRATCETGLQLNVVGPPSSNEARSSTCDENLPPFTAVSFKKVETCMNLPSLSFALIYQFMIERGRGDGAGINNFKGLDKSVRHYDAGDIQDLCMVAVDKTTIYFRAYCLASMKKQRYQVYISVSVAEDTNSCTSVDFAYCQCPIGLAQSCSHIGALLFTISNRKTGNAKTSELCEWNVPRAKNPNPQPFRELNLSKPKIDSSSSNPYGQSNSNFDPRHTADRLPSMSRSLSHLSKLKQIFPQTGMCSLWNIPDEVPTAGIEEEVITSLHPLQTKMKEMIITDENFPPLFIDEELQSYIEEQTREQRASQMWKDLHLGRLTSSLFGDVLKTTNSSSLIAQIVNGSNLDRYSSLPEPIQWGINMEGKAREEYLNLQQAIKGDVHVLPTGLTISTTYSFLGASSDGRIVEGDEIGVLEIKCPFSLHGININNMEIDEILNLDNSGSFFLENGDFGPKLKRNHKYYAQVQGEMSLMGLPWSDFVVWTSAKKNNIFVERIPFDIEFCNNMLPKLVEFYITKIYPKIYEK